MATAQRIRGLTDTDVLIDHTRGVADASAFLTAEQAAHGVFISVVSAIELVQGCRDARQLRSVHQLLSTMTVLPITDVISRGAFHLVDSLFLSHGLRMPDALIGATALEYAWPLYTKNTRHFQPIPGLRIARPY